MESLPSLPLKLKVNILLRAKQYLQARDLIASPQSFNDIAEHGMEIISQICEHGLDETEDFSEILICADMLIYIAQHFNPKLALISFLEQAEVFNFSPKFSVFIQPLKIIVSRMPNKKPSNVAWILKTLNSHLKTFESIPHVVRQYKNQKDELAIQANPYVQQMLYFYNQLCNFYDGLVAELFTAGDPGQGPGTSSTGTEKIDVDALKNIFRNYIVDLLGPPLVHLNLSVASEIEPPVPFSAPKTVAPTPKPDVKSGARLIAEKILHILSALKFDPNYFVQWLERKQSPTAVWMQSDDSEDDICDNDLDITEPQSLSVSCFMYLIYGVKLHPTLLPASTYSPSYIFGVNLYLVNEFLSTHLENESHQLKGLLLARGMIDRVNSASPLTEETFDLVPQSTFLDQLATLVVFCESRRVRVIAIDVFTKYLRSYDARGKRKMLTHLFYTVKDPGLFGHCITQLKDFIMTAIYEKETNVVGENTMPECFLGRSLLNMLKPLCTLDNGEQTDLVHTCNKIIPMLNLLRFVFVRDGTRNFSGIKEIMADIEANFLKPLRLGLDLSKVHFQQRLEEVKNSENPTPSFHLASGDVSIITLANGEELQCPPELTKEEQIECIGASLGTLDLLDSLWTRVSETSMTLALNSQTI